MHEQLVSAKPQRLRKLSREEIELWQQVAGTITPRPGAFLPEHDAQIVPPTKPNQPRQEPVRLHGPSAASYSPPGLPAKSHALPLAPLERRLKQQLLRGRSSVDQVLDLHGLRQSEAHNRLQHFLLRAQTDGARIVLVITGKGKPGPANYEFEMEGGILRRLVPHWLRAPDLRGQVIGFEEAGGGHGGSGALYVRIRRFERGR